MRHCGRSGTVDVGKNAGGWEQYRWQEMGKKRKEERTGALLCLGGPVLGLSLTCRTDRLVGLQVDRCAEEQQT